MSNLTVKRDKAIEAFNGATPEQQEILKAVLGAEPFEPKITDKVKSFESACTVLGIKPEDVLAPAAPALKHIEKQLHAQAKLIVIAQALNQGWLPDWEDGSQPKWYPWFEKRSSGFGFSDSRCDGSYSTTAVGSRLYYATDELAIYAGKLFESLYNEMLSI